MMGGRKVRASQFIIHDAASLLGAIHAPIVASAGKTGVLFRVTPVDDPVENDYFTSHDFVIEYLGPTNGDGKKGN